MSEAKGDASTRDRAIAIVLAGLACFALVRAWQFGQSVPGIDYYQFWVVGEAIEHDGVANPYLDSERARMGALYLERANGLDPASRQSVAAQGRAVLETYSTPFLYTAIHALASGDYERDFTRWHLLSLIAFAAGVLGFARIVGMGWSTGLAVLILTTLFGTPFQSESQVANVNRVQLGMLALAAALPWRSGSVAGSVGLGAVLALAAMFKPNVAFAVLLVVVAVAVHRERPQLLGLLVGLALGVGAGFSIGAFFFGAASAWMQWAQTLAVIPDEIIHVSLGNYAALPLIWGATNGVASMVAALVLCAPVIVALVRLPRAGSQTVAAKRVAVAIGLGCVIALMTATLVWEHYFLLALPLLICVSADATTDHTLDAMGWLRLRVLPGIAFLALLATPTFGIAGLPHETYFPLVQGGALVLLYGLGTWALFQPTEGEAIS